MAASQACFSASTILPDLPVFEVPGAGVDAGEHDETRRDYERSHRHRQPGTGLLRQGAEPRREQQHHEGDRDQRHPGRERRVTERDL